MELRQLRYFVAVAESGNISRAAQKIHLTQPALSRQIKALEEELGQPLLERMAHSIRLTRTGEVLLEEAREVLQRVEAMVERVRNLTGGVCLRVGYAPSFASGFLADAVERFAQKHPQARVELLDLSTQEILAGLEEHKLDVALTVDPERESGVIRWTPLVTARWRLAVNQHHPLAKRREVTPEEVAREPLLAFHRKEYPEYWEILTRWRRDHRQRPAIAGEYDGVNSLLAAVSSGLGVAMVTTTTAGLIPPRVRMIELSAPPKALAIVAGHRSDRDPGDPAAVLIEELKLASKEMKW